MNIAVGLTGLDYYYYFFFFMEVWSKTSFSFFRP